MRPLPIRRFAAETLVALNVMRDHAASDPQRKLELAGLLASGTVTQAAIDHAGHCDGGARSRLAMHAAVAEEMRANPNGCAS